MAGCITCLTRVYSGTDLSLDTQVHGQRWYIKHSAIVDTSNNIQLSHLNEMKLENDSDSIKRSDLQTDIQMCKEGLISQTP